jgi:hypothetical protein
MTGARGLVSTFRLYSKQFKAIFGNAFLCFLAVGVGPLLLGQATGSISGAVTDAKGAT